MDRKVYTDTYALVKLHNWFLSFLKKKRLKGRILKVQTLQNFSESPTDQANIVRSEYGWHVIDYAISLFCRVRDCAFVIIFEIKISLWDFGAFHAKHFSVCCK